MYLSTVEFCFLEYVDTREMSLVPSCQPNNFFLDSPLYTGKTMRLTVYHNQKSQRVASVCLLQGNRCTEGINVANVSLVLVS